VLFSGKRVFLDRSLYIFGAFFFVFVNNTPTNFFSSSHGLRQGNPLSPLLFVIVTEALKKMVSTTGGEGN
jgi:hypothetical protein